MGAYTEETKNLYCAARNAAEDLMVVWSAENDFQSPGKIAPSGLASKVSEIERTFDRLIKEDRFEISEDAYISLLEMQRTAREFMQKTMDIVFEDVDNLEWLPDNLAGLSRSVCQAIDDLDNALSAAAPAGFA